LSPAKEAEQPKVLHVQDRSPVTTLAEQKPEKLERAAVRWHGRLETEATFLSLAESQLALAALASLCAGERDAIEVLRRLLRRVRPALISSFPSQTR